MTSVDAHGADRPRPRPRRRRRRSAPDRHRRRSGRRASRAAPTPRPARKPVISPAPLSTATPAGTGSANRPSAGPGRIAVTPVRAIPRPRSGSSRQTVTWPTRTPATSVIASCGPALERRRSAAPSSPAGAGPRGSGRRRIAGRSRYRVARAWRARRIPVVWTDAHRGHVPGGEVWIGVRTPATRCGAGRARSAPRSPAPGAPVVDAAPQPDERLLARPRPRPRRVPRRRLGRLGGGRAARGPRPGPRRAVLLRRTPGCSAGSSRRCPPPRAARTGLVRLRHDDADRPGHVGGGARRRSTPRSPPPTSCSTARPPRTPAAARPGTTSRAPPTAAPATSTTRRSRRSAPARGARRPGRDRRRRRAPRQRRAVDLLGATPTC